MLLSLFTTVISSQDGYASKFYGYSMSMKCHYYDCHVSVKLCIILQTKPLHQLSARNCALRKNTYHHWAQLLNRCLHFHNVLMMHLVEKR